jgi:muramoyltetrapeptide carboxypeptidase
VLDGAALARHQRFAGDDAQRLAALHRVAAAGALGGAGQPRRLRPDAAARPHRLAAAGAQRGPRHALGRLQRLTALQLGCWRTPAPSWAGPMAAGDFGRSDAEGGVDEVTRDCFCEAMSGALEAVGFRTEAGFDGLQARASCGAAT